jgi:hypothetical protein
LAGIDIDFYAPAVLKKWPSLNKERVPKTWGATPYFISAGALDECIKAFMSRSASGRHLYEIHTTAQPPLVTEVLQAEHIVELARLREFLWLNSRTTSSRNSPEEGRFLKTNEDTESATGKSTLHSTCTVRLGISNEY